MKCIVLCKKNIVQKIGLLQNHYPIEVKKRKMFFFIQRFGMCSIFLKKTVFFLKNNQTTSILESGLVEIKLNNNKYNLI